MGEYIKEFGTWKEGKDQQRWEIIWTEGGRGFCCKWTISSVWSVYSYVPNKFKGQNKLVALEKFRNLINGGLKKQGDRNLKNCLEIHSN